MSNETTPEGTARMQGPANCGGCSWDGETYPADANGIVVVPMAAVRTLEKLGFRVIPSNTYA